MMYPLTNWSIRALIRSVGKVKYSFKSGSDLVDLSGEDILLKDKEYIMGKGGGNGAVIRANETIEVTVEWNGQIEKFKLNPTGPIPMWESDNKEIHTNKFEWIL